ncbi:MAG TPA: hypothetical protein VIM68_08640 [Thermoanaerobaculia bacterium]
MRCAKVAAGLLACFVATPAFAHHGKDFLIVESYELPHPSAIYAISSEQLVFDRSNVTFRDEPSLLIGLTDRVAAEVHAHIQKMPHGSASLGAVAPAVHVRLFDFGALHTGVSAEYEIGRHGAGNNATLRVIAAHPAGQGAVVGNIGVSRSHGEGTTAIYAVGYRPDMEARTSWGVEAQGILRHASEHEILGAVYGQVGERLTLKAGVGAVVGTGKPSALVRTGIVWRF